MTDFTVQFQITVAHAPATYLPASGPVFAPLAPGTVVGSVTGDGAIVVLAPFAASGSNIVVGPSPLAAGSYTVTGTMGGAPFSGSLTVFPAAVYTPRPGPFYAPLAPATIVGSVTGGTTPLTAVAPFAVSGANIIVGPSPLSAGPYTVSGSAGGSTFTSSLSVLVPAAFTPAAGPFFAPLASGTVVGTVTGSGTFAVNSPFVMSGSNVVVGAQPLAAATYTISGTAGSSPYTGSVTVLVPVVFTAAPGPFYAPLPTGTIVGSVTGNGVRTVSSPFAISGQNIVVGPTPLTAGSYTPTGTVGGIAFNGSITVATVPTATYTPAGGTVFAPLASGTVVGSVSGGSGTVTVNSPFVASGTNIVVGAVPLAAGSYTITGSRGGISPFSGSLTVNATATFTPASGPFFEPLASATVVGSVSGGTGTITVNSPFVVSGTDIVVGAAPLAAGSYTITGSVGGVSPFSGAISVAVSAVYTPAAGPFFSPLASGTVVGSVSGVGTILVSAPFAVSGTNIVVGASALAAGSYTVSGSRGGSPFSASLTVTQSAVYTAATGPFYAPLASGTVVGSVTGPGAFSVNAPFLMSGSNVVVGASALAAGSYTITGSSGGSPFSGSLTVAVAVTFTPTATALYAPLAPNTVVGSVTGTGTRLVSSPFVMSGANVVVGASALAAATYPVTGSVGGVAYSGSIVVQPALVATFTPAPGTFYAPLASGTVVGSISGTATGTITVSSPFAVSGTNIVVGAAALAAGSYSITGNRGGTAFSGSMSVVTAFTVATGPFFNPLASGSIVGTVGGTEAITVSSPFSVAGRSIVVGPSPLGLGVYTITGTVGAQPFSGSINVSDPVPTTQLSAVVTVNGVSTTFTQSGATNMGDYVDTDPSGPFTQQCFRAPFNSAVPWYRVWFRPDSTSNRKEVVFELGDISVTPKTVASITSGNPTTITTSVAHGMITGVSPVLTGLTYIAPNNFGSPKILSIDSPTQITVQVNTSVGSQVLGGAHIGASTPVASITPGSTTIIVTTTPHGLTVVGSTIATTGLIYWTVNNIGPSKVITVTGPTTFTVPVDSTLGTGAAKTATANVGVWNMGPHTVQIYNDGALVHTQSMTLHYWGARWRWQSAARPVRKTPAELIASGKVSNYGTTINGVPTVYANYSLQPAYSPMGFSGMVTGMGNTGPRPDIGPITGWGSNWLAKGTAGAPNAIPNIFTHAECSGTLQQHYRGSDGAPFDCIALPNVTTNLGASGATYVYTTTGLVAYDSGHHPTLGYLPALLTGDPYHIEACQFQASRLVLDQAPGGFRYGAGGRYGAWPQRDYAYAAAITPDVVPSWLRGKAVFRAYLESVRAKWITSMNNTTDTVLTVLRCRNFGGSQGGLGFPSGNYWAPWQTDYEVCVAWICVQLGFTEWRPQAEWMTDNTVARVDGTHDIPRAVPTAYQDIWLYSAYVNTAMDATQTTMDAGDFGKGVWPTLPFIVTVQSEKMNVTARDLTTGIWTVQRGVSGTTAAAHAKFQLGVAHTWILGRKFNTWEEYGARVRLPQYMVERAAMPSDPSGMNVINYTVQIESVQATRHALALAVRNGYTPATDALNWINGQFAQYMRSTWTPDWRWMAN